jgi:signal peptidase
MVLEGGLTKRIPYEVQAPDAPGYYQAYVSIDIYLGILPYDVTFALRDVHPYLPLIVIDVIAVLLSLPILVVLRNEAQRTERTRSRKRPVKTF